MSIDPAIITSEITTNAMPFEDLRIFPNAVYVFDFDGVISSSFEDDIYRLPATEDEMNLIATAAKSFDIRCEGMEQRYQRHLIYQAAAWKLGIEIPAGLGLSAAKRAGEISRLFILTARSGWYATERMRKFLQANSVLPIEIYSVGRVKKDRQVELICREFSDAIVYFVEDSPAHLASVAKASLKNVNLVLLQQKVAPQCDVEYLLTEHFRQVVSDALKLGVVTDARPNRF
jgi:hypothetical protein